MRILTRPSSTEKPVAKAKPKPKSVVNSNVNVSIPERKWIDIDPQPFDRSCFEVLKFMTRTLRHETSISSRRRRSSEIRRSDQQIKGSIWLHFAVDSQYLGEFFGTGTTLLGMEVESKLGLLAIFNLD